MSALSLAGKYLLVTMYRRGRIPYLVCRREGDLRKVTFRIVDFFPYFYVPDPAGQFRAIDGTRVRKIILDDPSRVPEVRKNYSKHYEADVPYIERCVIDLNIMRGLRVKKNSVELSVRDVEPCDDVNVPVRKWYVDIEVLAPEMPDPADPKYEIILVSIYDTYENIYITLVQHPSIKHEEVIEREQGWYVWYLPDERSLLETFLRLWREAGPDLVMGWNVSFDVSYLVNRMRILGMSLPYEEADYLDLLYMYRDFLKVRQPSYKLKHVAYREGLADSPEALVRDIPEAYRSDLDRLILYNKTDVYYVVELDKRYEMSDFALALKWAVGLPRISRFEHVNPGMIKLVAEIHNHKLIDIMLLRLAKRRGIVLPSKPERGQVEEESYKGAIVLQPPQGLIEWVCVFDMSRYYPSIIVSFNLSPETLTRDVSDPGRVIHVAGLFFKREPKGIIPELAEYFVKRREEIEARLRQLQPGTPEYERLKRERDAVKYLANAVYGVMGFVGFRLFKREVAETVTAIGREGILKICEIARELGYNPVYGDSITGDMPVILKVDDEIVVDTIGKIFDTFAQKYGIVKSSDKEYVIIPETAKVYALAYDPTRRSIVWSRVKSLMRHKVNKRIYTVISRLGLVKVTEDHSFVNESGIKKKPEEITLEDIMFVRKLDFSHIFDEKHEFNFRDLIYRIIRDRHYTVISDDGEVVCVENDVGPPRKTCIRYRYRALTKEMDALLKLIAFYLADDSIINIDREKRWFVLSFSNTDDRLLEMFREAVEIVTAGSITKDEPRVIRACPYLRTDPVVYEDKTKVVRVYGEILCELLVRLCGMGNDKHIPSFIFSLPKEDVERFLTYIIYCDGAIHLHQMHKETHMDKVKISNIIGYFRDVEGSYIEITTASYVLATQLVLLLLKLGFSFSINVKESNGRYYLNVQPVKGHAQRGKTLRKSVQVVNDIYVYDIDTEVDTFIAGAGMYVLHNTDSVFIQILPEKLNEAADDRERLKLVVETAQRVVEIFNQRISQYLREKYNVPDPRIRLKFERVFRRVIFAGVKKRYAGLVVWEDGKECNYLMVKGFEAVRSDTPPFTQEVQKRLFELILSGASREEIIEFLRKKIEEFREKCRKLDVNDIAIPKGLSKNVDEYEHQPPHVRAVIYSNMYLRKNFTRGAKVLLVYVKSIPGLPPTDVVAIEDSSDLPPGTVIDVDTMLEKALFQKIDKILELVGLTVGSLKQRRIVKLFA